MTHMQRDRIRRIERRIERRMDQKKEGGGDVPMSVRILITPVENVMKTEVTVVIVREDGFVVEVLRFAIDFVVE